MPGWDCHGLPIEHAVEKKHGRVGRKIDAKAFRAACRSLRTEQVDLQRKDFKRLGVMGDWDRPYLTMAPGLRGAADPRARQASSPMAICYKGAKPVYWCLDCRSALAEAEVDYEDRTSTAIDVAFQVVDGADFARRAGAAAQAASLANASLVIWTTTPWTLPANEAVALGAEIDYALHACTLSDGRSVILLLASALAEGCLQRYDATSNRLLTTVKGAPFERLLVRHPFLPREVPIIVGEHVTLFEERKRRKAGLPAWYFQRIRAMGERNLAQVFDGTRIAFVRSKGRAFPSEKRADL